VACQGFLANYFKHFTAIIFYFNHSLLLLFALLILSHFGATILKALKICAIF